LIQVFVIVAVAKFDNAAIWESKYFLRLVVSGKAVQLFPQLIDMVVHQFREGAANNQDLNASIKQRK
jgi:hypothetical protein